jgi:hypothetical protein
VSDEDRAPVLPESDKRIALACPMPSCDWVSSSCHPDEITAALRGYAVHRRTHPSVEWRNWWVCTCGQSVPNGRSHDTGICGGAGRRGQPAATKGAE